MQNTQLGIHHLSFEEVNDVAFLSHYIYPDAYKNYYWSEDFSPEYYIAQAKAGFIAVTDVHEEKELLLPEIQFSYALIDFDALHCSKKVSKLIRKKNLHIEIDSNIEEVAQHINNAYKDNWLSPRYVQTLQATHELDKSFKVITVYIEEAGEMIAGEIGYILGKTYTSLSGFSSKTKPYQNYGTAQLVLLGQYLHAQGFAFWNLGQPYMDYKLALGAKVYEREDFLLRWFDAI